MVPGHSPGVVLSRAPQSVSRASHAALASVLLLAAGLAPGCGRRLPDRDDGAPPGDTGLDEKNDRPDGATQGDAALDGAGVDLGAEVTAEVPVQVRSDAEADRPDGGPVDVGTTPDLGLPEAGQDLSSDRGPPDAGQDTTPDGGPDGAPDCGTPSNLHHCGTCDHDCTALLHVIVSLESLACESGVCHAYTCAQGYAHCSATSPDKACETSLWSDPENCGGCGVRCGQLPGSPGVCHNGACVGECPDGWGDCTDAFGCETALGAPENCGACGRPACALANVLAPCRQPASSCDEGICAPGYGNCDRSNPDCEAAYGASGTCVPRYAGTAWVPTGQNGVMSVAPDGTRFIGGQFAHSVDFDSTAGVDVHDPSTPGGMTAYVTAIKPDGGYGWTRTFPSAGQASVVALAGTAGGGVVVGGNFQGSISLDPSGVAPPSSYPIASAFIVELDGKGAFVQGSVLELLSGSIVSVGSIAVAADGSTYVGGTFQGDVDFDPGPAIVYRGSTGYADTFILKLNKDHSFAWVDTWGADPSMCFIYPGRLAVAPSGTVLTGSSYAGMCDFDPGSGVDFKQGIDGNGGNGFVLALDAAGGYVGTWTFGTWVQDVAADEAGAIYAAGIYSGTYDFDPGPAEVLRTSASSPSSFVVKLDAAGTFQWVSTEVEFSARAMALGPAGSVLVAGMISGGAVDEAGVVELLPDQSPGWTIGFGSGELDLDGIGATATGFFVGGYVYQNTDLDPGTGVYVVPGGSPSGTPFVAAYAF